MKKPGPASAASLAVVPVEPDAPPKATPAEAPAHLSADAAQWWRSVVTDYELEPHHLRLLEAAANAWDRMEQARQALADHGGITFTDDKGMIRSHPAVAIERDARTAFARLVRELDLDAGAPADSRRPPALVSNRRAGDAG